MSTASTRYDGVSSRWRKPITGCQYAARDDGSFALWTTLKASGVAFHESASANAPSAYGSGRHRRSESVSTASGTAA